MLTRFVIEKLITRAYPPTGVWRDFDFDVRWWNYLKNMVELGHIPADDLPPEPLPLNYTNYTSSKTRG